MEWLTALQGGRSQDVKPWTDELADTQSARPEPCDWSNTQVAPLEHWGQLALVVPADPRFLKSSELPEDSDLLSQRPEYWVSSKDVLPDPQDGDEVSLTVSLDGAVICSVNGGPQRVLFHTDISLNTRPFIDIFGATQKIQILGIKSYSFSQSPSRTPSSPSNSLATTECVVCCESEVDCVLYSCGHMCMCFQCAVNQWAKAGECPICRQPIKDVIRTYRA